MRGAVTAVLFLLPVHSVIFGVDVDVIANDLTALLEVINTTFVSYSKDLSAPINIMVRDFNCKFPVSQDKSKWIYCAYNEILNALSRIKSVKGLGYMDLERLIIYTTRVLCDFKLYLMQTDKERWKYLPGCSTRECDHQRRNTIFQILISLRDARHIVQTITKNIRQIDKNKQTIGRLTGDFTSTTVPYTTNEPENGTTSTESYRKRLNNRVHIRRRRTVRAFRHRRKKCKKLRGKKRRRRCRRRVIRRFLCRRCHEQRRVNH